MATAFICDPMPSFYEIEALAVETLGNMTIYMNRIGNMDQISDVLKSLEWLHVAGFWLFHTVAE